MIPWNSSALTLKLNRRGVANESIKGSFEFDVVFTSNISGFVVQYIQKKLTYKKKASSVWKKIQRAYWEIFYIGDDGMSWNADRFAQTSLGNESEGCLIQIGYAYFFPYAQPVVQDPDKVDIVQIQITKDIKRIFGKEVQYKIKMANGLPCSYQKPKMKGLQPIPNAIIHKLTVNWGEHAEPLGSQLNYSDDGKTIEGWDSVVVEEVFAGENIYQKFPWTSSEERPLLKDQDERNKYLSEEEWGETLVNLNRPEEYLDLPIPCTYCQNTAHLEERWRYFHPEEDP